MGGDPGKSGDMAPPPILRIKVVGMMALRERVSLPLGEGCPSFIIWARKMRSIHRRERHISNTF